MVSRCAHAVRSTVKLTTCRVWVIYFIDAFEGPTGWQLTPYVTSSFSLHGLTAITGVVAQLVAGLFRLPLAKVCAHEMTNEQHSRLTHV